MVKYKCFKIQCPVCGMSGSCQTFLNKQNKITYARTRHYLKLNENKKPQFEYHKIENLEALKTLLNAPDSTGKADNGQVGQGYTANNVDPKLLNPRLNFEMAGPAGFEPTTFSLEGKQNVDPKAYREYLNNKYSRKYASLLFGYITKHYQCFLNPNELKIPASIRSNVMKAMVSFAKYTSSYEEYKAKLKNSGIKWVSNDSAFTSFLRIVNNNHSDLGEWYSEMQRILRDNEKLFLKFVLITG